MAPRRGVSRLASLLACWCVVAASLSASACRTSYAFRVGELTPIVTAGHDHTAKTRVRFLVFGDSGNGNEGQRAVARGMAKACAGRSCDFGLAVGDNIYPAGIASVADPQLGPKFHGPYDPLGLDLWLWPGNHDWYNKATLQPAIERTRHASNASGAWKMPFNHYAVPSLPDWLHVYGLDTTVMADLIEGKTQEQERALRDNASRQLTAARQRLCGQDGWKLLVGHHFVHSSGSRHGSKSGSMADQVEPIIRDCGVQLYVSGHDHHQELLEIQSGGATYHQVVQGAGSEHRSVRGAPPPGVERKFVAAEMGFSVVDASREHLRMGFYVCNRQGECTERHVLELRRP